MMWRGRLVMIVFVAAMAVWAIAHVFSEARGQSLCGALSNCAQVGDNVCVRQKLSEGADPNCGDGEPMRRANAYGHGDTADILQKAGSTSQPR